MTAMTSNKPTARDGPTGADAGAKRSGLIRSQNVLETCTAISNRQRQDVARRCQCCQKSAPHHLSASLCNQAHEMRELPRLLGFTLSFAYSRSDTLPSYKEETLFQNHVHSACSAARHQQINCDSFVVGPQRVS